MMGDTTKNLSRHEFKCHCGCGLADPHPLLVIGIQDIFDRIGAEKVIITSGSRCQARNKYLVNMGMAAESSRHLSWEPSGYTQAADCIFHGVTLASVVAAARTHKDFSRGGIGLYVGQTPRVHLDVRGYHARWGVIDGKKSSFFDALAEMHRRQL